MTELRFDHFICFADVPSIEEQLDRYRQLGFEVSPATVRHQPGLRNGFLRFGPEYLEFVWVEDEAVFAAEGEALREARAARRPYALLFHASDPQALHQDRRRRGYPLPEVVHQASLDDPEGGPVWSFQPLPGVLPGIQASIISYRRHNPQRLEVRVHPNSLYAVQGALFVTPDPQRRAEQWRDFLAPGGFVELLGSAAQFELGPHTASWLTPDAAAGLFGQPWHAHVGELAAIHLLATSLVHLRQVFEAAGRRVREFSQEELGLSGLLLEAGPTDGFVFLVTQRPVHDWLNARRAITHEALTAEPVAPPSAE